MGRKRVLIIVLSVFLVACGSKPEYTLSKKDISAMKERFIFNQNGKKAYMPLICCLKNYVFKVISVPGENRVGTIELDNGFTLIKFRDDELDYDLIAKDYEEEVYGDYTYSFAPVYSENEILYGQNSWLIKINLKNKTAKEYNLFNKVVAATDEHCHRLVYSSEGFLCEIQVGNYDRYLKNIKLLNLSDPVTVKKDLPAGTKTLSYDQPWQLNKDIIFTYDSSANKLICHTTELKQTILSRRYSIEIVENSENSRNF